MRGLLGILWRHRLATGLSVLCVLVSDLAQLTVPMLLRGTIDPLVAGQATHDLLVRQAGSMAALALLAYTARWGWQWSTLRAARLAERRLRQQIFEQALRLSAADQARLPAGEIMALVSNDLASVRSGLTFGFVAAFDAIVFLKMAVLAMLWLDWRLALATLAPYPLLALVMRLALVRSYATWDRVQSCFGELLEKTRASVAGMRVLRAYRQAAGDAADFQAGSETLYQHTMTYQRWEAVYTPAILLMSGASSAILLWLGGGHVVAGVTTLGSFVVFSSYLGQLLWPMMAMGWTFTVLQRAVVSMRRIEAFLARPGEPAAGGDGRPGLWTNSASRKDPGEGPGFAGPEPVGPEAEFGPLSRLEPRGGGDLRIQGLTFTYPESARPALEEVTLEVPAGGSLGLVGEVGSGKSTLALLLLRLYDPPRGTVFLDGQDVLDLPLPELRSRIAWVQQESFLFSDTIATNLALAAPDDVTEARCLEVAGQAALHEEVMEFPQGYQTLLGERGVTLSGGQRQRLSLARALLKPASLLVLDDTLSAVDAESERSILAALQARRLALGQTTLVIAHRLSSVMHLEQIVVLEQGRVAQRGTHADLLARPGLYRRLYELQGGQPEA